MLETLLPIDQDYFQKFGWRQASIWGIEEPESSLHSSLEIQIADLEQLSDDATGGDERVIKYVKDNSGPIKSRSDDAPWSSFSIGFGQQVAEANPTVRGERPVPSACLAGLCLQPTAGVHVQGHRKALLRSFGQSGGSERCRDCEDCAGRLLSRAGPLRCVQTPHVRNRCTGRPEARRPHPLPRVPSRALGDLRRNLT